MWAFSYHTDLNMDNIVTALRTLFQVVTGVRPRFRVHGGSDAENLALQNIQARLRMVIAYFFAQLLPWVRGRTGGLLVLGSANVDERCICASSSPSGSTVASFSFHSDASMGTQLAWVLDEVRLLFRSVLAPLGPFFSDSVFTIARDRGTAADVNPIGGISKTDLKRFIAWAQENFHLPILSR